VVAETGRAWIGLSTCKEECELILHELQKEEDSSWNLYRKTDILNITVYQELRKIRS